MSMQGLPVEIRLQILSQLPLSSLLELRFLSKDLYADVDALFCTRRYVLRMLERIHMRVTAEHKGALEKYLGSADSTICDDYIHTMFVLIHLMKRIGNIRLNLESHLQSKSHPQRHTDLNRAQQDHPTANSNDFVSNQVSNRTSRQQKAGQYRHHQYHQQGGSNYSYGGHSSSSISKALVQEVVLRCESAARQCENAGRAELWTSELRTLLYPSATCTRISLLDV